MMERGVGELEVLSELPGLRARSRPRASQAFSRWRVFKVKQHPAFPYFQDAWRLFSSWPLKLSRLVSSGTADILRISGPAGDQVSDI